MAYELEIQTGSISICIPVAEGVSVPFQYQAPVAGALLNQREHLKRSTCDTLLDVPVDDTVFRALRSATVASSHEPLFVRTPQVFNAVEGLVRIARSLELEHDTRPTIYDVRALLAQRQATIARDLAERLLEHCFDSTKPRTLTE